MSTMRWVLVGALAAADLAGAASVAVAAPDTAHIVRTQDMGGRYQTIMVFSPAMNRAIPVQVVPAADPSRPTVYLLNGSQGGPGQTGWDTQTDAFDFLHSKDVNVVTPFGGGGSYYTDWIRDDPVLGRNKWQTFLNEELPPVVEKYLRANGNRAAAGLSMSGTSVLNLAIAKPGFWKSVASYSGCAQASDPIGQEAIRITVENWSHAQSVENMWGPLDGPLWRANDPLVNAARLRGTPIYLSAGTGIPAAPHDTPFDRRAWGPGPLPAQIFVGGPIEAAAHYCTVNLTNRLHELNIPVVTDFPPVGTHSWGYWEDELHRSWPFLAQTIGSRP
nr:alpha/beta hydrolase family protein [Nocardia alni]